MGRRFDTVSFLSDLGVVDETVGVFTAILRDMAPHVTVVHLTHGIEVGDVRGGSLALARSIAYVPAGIVVAAVDAGLDSGRLHVAVEVAGGEGVLIGPDNGLLAPAVAMAGGADRAVVLDVADHHLGSPGSVMPVRDVYAPVAAALCSGADLSEVGSSIPVDAVLPGMVPLPREDGDAVIGEVVWVGRRGDCQLNIGLDELGAWGDGEGRRVQVVAGTGDHSVTRVAERVAHSGVLGPGAVGLVVDPSGMLALVLHQRSAAEELAVVAGDQVTLRPLAEGDRGPGVSSPVQLRPR